MGVKTKEELSVLHTALANALLTRVQSEGVSASDLAVAAKFLKDNDVVAAKGESDGVAALEQELAAARTKRKVTQEDLNQALQDLEFSGALQ